MRARTIAEALPGDSLIPAPRYQTMRTIEIAAAPDAVWSWLVQIGQGRGGFYSYDLLENLLGLGIHSANEIRPELQRLAVGDVISLDPKEQMPMTVVELEPAQRLVLRSGPPGRPVAAGAYFRGGLAASWAFVLEPLAAERTRLAVRLRSDWQPSIPAAVFQALLLRPAHAVMERGMLRGIRARTERTA